MYASSGKLLQAAMLLALASTGTLAAKCDFKLTQSASGQFRGEMSRLEVGNLVAGVISKTEDAIWSGFVKKGNNLTVSDYQDTLVAYTFDQMPESELSYINHLINVDLQGVTVTSQAGGHIAVNPNGSNVHVSAIRGAYRFGDNSQKDTVYYAGSRGFNLTHIIYQNNSAVFLVDEECEIVQLKSLHEVDRQLQSFLKDVMDDEQ